MRLTHLVNYDCLLLQVDLKNWLERVEKRINCIQQNAQQGNRSFCDIGHFVSTAKFCINVVSVKYNEKTGEIVKFLNQLMNQNSLQKLTYISWRLQYFQSSFLACFLARVKFMAGND